MRAKTLSRSSLAIAHLLFKPKLPECPVAQFDFFNALHQRHKGLIIPLTVKRGVIIQTCTQKRVEFAFLGILPEVFAVDGISIMPGLIGQCKMTQIQFAFGRLGEAVLVPACRKILNLSVTDYIEILLIGRERVEVILGQHPQELLLHLLQ